MTTNSYALRGPDTDLAYGEPQPDYINTDDPAPYDRSGSPYATPYDPDVDGTPDPTRVGAKGVTDSRVDPTHPVRWWERLFGERRDRYSVERSRGLITREVSPPRRAAVDPRSVVQPNSRVTQDLNPSTYSFTRPMTGGTRHRLTGEHSSMADHARYDQQLYGMAPARSSRNTFRLDLPQWGEQMTDIPASTYDPTPAAYYTPPDAVSSRKAWRL